MTGPVTEPTTNPAPAAEPLLSQERKEAPAPENPKSAGEVLYPAAGLEEGAGNTTAPVVAKPPEGNVTAPVVEEPPVEAPKLTVESYDIKLPETIAVDDALLAKFKEASVEAQVPPEVAQKYADLYVEALNQQSSLILSNWETTKSNWTNEINSMPEFQGERAAQSKAVLGSLLEEFGSPGVRDFFTQTGDNPAIVKMLLDIASVLVEGEPASPGSPTGPTDRRNRSLGERLYPDQTN